MSVFKCVLKYIVVMGVGFFALVLASPQLPNGGGGTFSSCLGIGLGVVMLAVWILWSWDDLP